MSYGFILSICLVIYHTNLGSQFDRLDYSIKNEIFKSKPELDTLSLLINSTEFFSLNVIKCTERSFGILAKNIKSIDMQQEQSIFIQNWGYSGLGSFKISSFSKFNVELEQENSRYFFELDHTHDCNILYHQINGIIDLEVNDCRMKSFRGSEEIKISFRVYCKKES